MVRVVRYRFRRQYASSTDPGKRAFISYSRKDKAFAEALVDDLQGRGINVWIDRRDIAPTTEWMAEIEDGIRRSDNFVFLISPDSIQSATCQAELAHAEQHNKRIVPVDYREVDPGDTRDSVRKRQWLAGDDPDAIARWLMSDGDRARRHSRILTQAWDWKESGHRRSALLRGQELRSAQQWINNNDTDHDPNPDDPSSDDPSLGELDPTRLQRDYVGASRVASRQRVAAGTVAMVALLVSAVLLGTTLIRAGHADESRRLAQLAGEQTSDGLDVALLLGREALRTSDTVEARSALLAAVRTKDSQVNNVCFGLHDL